MNLYRKLFFVSLLLATAAFLLGNQLGFGLFMNQFSFTDNLIHIFGWTAICGQSYFLCAYEGWLGRLILATPFFTVVLALVLMVASLVLGLRESKKTSKSLDDRPVSYSGPLEVG
jgi:hypothetical protein